MPGMLSKRAKFAELGEDNALINRVTKVLLLTDLANDLTLPTSLWFWAMVLLSLQTQASAVTVVDWLVNAARQNPDHETFQNNLARYLSASDREELLSRL